MNGLPTFPAPADPLTWFLVGALVCSRGLDFLSTWIVTPGLELEANPLLRRASWGRMALLNLPLLGLPFLHHGLTVTFVVTSLLAAGSNFTAGALSRGMGEARQLEQQRQAIRSLGLPRALAMNSGGALIICLAGALLAWLTLPPERLAWWGSLGVVMFGLTGLVHFNLAIVRLHNSGRAARTGGANPSAAAVAPDPAARTGIAMSRPPRYRAPGSGATDATSPRDPTARPRRR